MELLPGAFGTDNLSYKKAAVRIVRAAAFCTAGKPAAYLIEGAKR